MMKLSRREAICGLVALGSLRMVSKHVSAAAGPHLNFPKKAQDRLSVTSYPFRSFIDAPGNADRDRAKPGMDLKDFARTIAERFSIHNINPLAGHFGSSTSAYVSELRTAVEKAGSHVVDLGLAGKVFHHPDASQREDAVSYGKKWIDVALEVGSPSVRQHLNPLAGHKSNVDLAALSLGKLAEYGSKRNIVINLENDDPLSEDPFFLVQVIEKVDNPYLCALPDFGNSILPSGDAELNAKAVRGMFRHVCNMCHVKAEVTGGQGKVYQIDLDQMFRIARESGYQGYFCMEFESRGDPFAGTAELIRKTLKYIS
jgi:sugar phosphate isomerase/epimerase